MSQSKNAFIHQIKDSYLKEYRRYAPDLMLILETWSEVRTFPHPNMRLHQIWDYYTPNNMRYAPT